MFFPCRADLVCENIFQIKAADLAMRGIKLLLADLDNTLVPYGVALPTEAVCAWKEELEKTGITLFVLSNNRHAERPKIFCQALGIPFIGHAGKPKTGSFFLAMKRIGVTREETAIIGDQIFTDVLGGSRAGVTTILVKPIRLAGNPGRYLRYAVELPFRILPGRKSKEGWL